jgi:hypothetical protein
VIEEVNEQFLLGVVFARLDGARNGGKVDKKTMIKRHYLSLAFGIAEVFLG